MTSGVDAYAAKGAGGEIHQEKHHKEKKKKPDMSSKHENLTYFSRGTHNCVETETNQHHAENTNRENNRKE